MSLNTPVPNLITTVGLFSAGAPVWSRRLNGILNGQAVQAVSAGAATLYTVHHPGTQSATRVFRFQGDGTSTAFTLPAAAAGVVYPTTNAASLTVVNYLEAIAQTYAPQYQLNAVTRQRVGSDATPTGTQFRINGTTVTFGTAPAAGLIVEVIIPVPTDIVQLGGGAFTANVPLVVQPRDFSTAGVAAVSLIAAFAR